MVAILFQDCDDGSSPQKDHCCPHKDLDMRHFCEYCDHGHSANKKHCDHGRNPIKTQKQDIFVRTVIMVTALINNAFYEDCDHDHNPQKLYSDQFMRTTIIITVLRNKVFFVRSQSSEIRYFFEEYDHSRSLLCCDHFVRTTIKVAVEKKQGIFQAIHISSALDMWVHVLTLKKGSLKQTKL